jgi:hypothetical protein
MLVCVPTCSETDGSCPEVLSIDYGVSCDSSEFQRGRVVALTTLTILGFAIPVWLLVKARRAVKLRDASLKLRMADMATWCGTPGQATAVATVQL